MNKKIVQFSHKFSSNSDALVSNYKICSTEESNAITNKIIFQAGGRTYLGLADSSTSRTLASSNFVKSGEKMRKNDETKWQTQAGRFSTKYTYLMSDMSLPQFTNNRKFEFTVNKFDTNKINGYNIILGRDVMHLLGLNIQFEDCSFQWGDITVPMVPRGH